MLVQARPAELAVAERVGAALPPREPPARQQRRWTTGACVPRAPAPPPRRASTGSLRDTPSSRWRSRRYRPSDLTMDECVERATVAMLAAEAKAAKSRVAADDSVENADPQMRFVTERGRAPRASPAKAEAPPPPPPASPVRARQPAAPPASPLQEQRSASAGSLPQPPKQQRPADDAGAKAAKRTSKPLRRTTGGLALQLHSTAESQRIKRRRPAGRMLDEKLDDDLKAYLGNEAEVVAEKVVEEEGVRLSAKGQHAPQVQLAQVQLKEGMPVESYVAPPSPSAMLEAV